MRTSLPARTGSRVNMREKWLWLLPAAAPLGAGVAHFLRLLARLLALLQPPLQEAQDEDEQREGGDEDEAGVGDDLVVGLAVQPLAVVLHSQRDRGQQREADGGLNGQHEEAAHRPGGYRLGVANRPGCARPSHWAG